MVNGVNRERDLTGHPPDRRLDLELELRQANLSNNSNNNKYFLRNENSVLLGDSGLPLPCRELRLILRTHQFP